MVKKHKIKLDRKAVKTVKKGVCGCFDTYMYSYADQFKDQS